VARVLSIGRRPILLSARTELLVIRRRISTPRATIVGILHLHPSGPPSGRVDGIRLLFDDAFEVQLGDLSEQPLTVSLAMVDEMRAIRGHGSQIN